MIPPILTFNFDLIFGSYLTFWGPNRLVLWFGQGWKTVLGSTHLVEQFSFSMLPSNLTFDFDLIFGSFLTLWAIFGVGVGFKTFLGSSNRD